MEDREWGAQVGTKHTTGGCGLQKFRWTEAHEGHVMRQKDPLYSKCFLNSPSLHQNSEWSPMQPYTIVSRCWGGRPGFMEEQQQGCSCWWRAAVWVSGRWPAPKAMAALRGAPRSSRTDPKWAWDQPTLLQMPREAISASTGRAMSEAHKLTSLAAAKSNRR